MDNNAIRRLKKQMTKPVAMADTNMAVNGCRVFLANPNPMVAKQAAEKFVGFMKYLNGRANRVNMQDLYEAHFRLLKGIKAGEGLMKIEEKGKSD